MLSDYPAAHRAFPVSRGPVSRTARRTAPTRCRSSELPARFHVPSTLSGPSLSVDDVDRHRERLPAASTRAVRWSIFSLQRRPSYEVRPLPSREDFNLYPSRFVFRRETDTPTLYPHLSVWTERPWSRSHGATGLHAIGRMSALRSWSAWGHHPHPRFRSPFSSHGRGLPSRSWAELCRPHPLTAARLRARAYRTSPPSTSMHRPVK